MAARLASADRTLAFEPGDPGSPNVWMFVGVNGVGKTTTIGKLAHQQTEAGRSVLLAAGDTFRAAAAEQLAMWADRSGVEFVRGAEGGDPSAVIFDGVERASARGLDLVLADTAGRLHTKTNLMDELRKVRRVAEKGAGRVTETLLVIDATTGQNGLAQAREFGEATQVTGVVLTKLDGSAKGGIVFAIETEFGIPVKLVGIGEGDRRPRDVRPRRVRRGVVRALTEGGNQIMPRDVETSMRTKLPAVVAAGAALTLLLAACGDDPDPNAARLLQPPVPVRVVAGSQSTAENDATRLVAADAPAAEGSFMPYVPGFTFEAGPGLPALPTNAVGYQYVPGGTVDAETVQALAEALDVDGEPVQGGGADVDGTLWRVGPDDGSASSITVSDDAQLSWYYSSAWAEGEGRAVSSCATSVDSEGNVTDEVCEEPEPPTGVPDAAAAEASATELLTALGEDASAYTYETYADEWFASVNAWTSSTASVRRCPSASASAPRVRSSTRTVSSPTRSRRVRIPSSTSTQRSPG